MIFSDFSEYFNWSQRTKKKNINCTMDDVRSRFLGLPIGLDSYIPNSFSHLEPISIYISHCMNSLLKLEITVWFSGFYGQ